MMPNGLDANDMVRVAMTSEEREAYFPLVSADRGRLGISVSAPEGRPEFILELLICILGAGLEVDLDRIYNGLDVAQEAQRMGFMLTSQGDGWIYCHKKVEPAELERQCGLAGRLID